MHKELQIMKSDIIKNQDVLLNLTEMTHRQRRINLEDNDQSQL